jgi:hypothetical protein
VSLLPPLSRCGSFLVACMTRGLLTNHSSPGRFAHCKPHWSRPSQMEIIYCTVHPSQALKSEVTYQNIFLGPKISKSLACFWVRVLANDSAERICPAGLQDRIYVRVGGAARCVGKWRRAVSLAWCCYSGESLHFDMNLLLSYVLSFVPPLFRG